MITRESRRQLASGEALGQSIRARGVAAMVMLLAVSVGACSPGAQATPAPLASGAASSTAASVAPNASASPRVSPSSEVPTVVEPSTGPESALKVTWEQGGPTPSKPCVYSPSVDSKGRIWVAVCWDSQFWIFSPGGKFLETWGVRGTEPGQFDFAFPASHDSIGGIAFASDGTFYTFDAGNLRIQRFGADRKLINSWGSFGTGDGQFAKPTSIAVDGRGHVFVADGSRVDVQEFESDGTFVKAIGANAIDSGGFVYIAVDQGGDVFANQGANVVKLGPDGPPIAIYDISAIGDTVSGMAVASSGSLFVQSRPDNAPQATIELGRDGRVVHVWPATGEVIALDPSGEAAYVTDVEWPFLRKYDLPGS
jgi:hypothetical protein